MEAVTSFDGTQIAVSLRGLDGGSEHVVLLLHGFASDHVGNWVAPGIVDALTARGRAVIAPDARGHGSSDTPHEPEAYAHDTLVRDARAVLDAYGVESVDVVGYSMGALVAARLVAVDSRTRSLVLGGAAGDLRRPPTDSGDGGLAAALLVDDPDRITHPVGRAFRDFADRSGADRHALAAFERSTALQDDVDFAAIAVPTLVLIGDRDHRAGSPDALATHIAGTRVERIAGDHLGAPANPAFARALTTFLDALD